MVYLEGDRGSASTRDVFPGTASEVGNEEETLVLIYNLPAVTHFNNVTGCSGFDYELSGSFLKQLASFGIRAQTIDQLIQGARKGVT